MELVEFVFGKRNGRLDKLHYSLFLLGLWEIMSCTASESRSIAHDLIASSR